MASLVVSIHDMGAFPVLQGVLEDTLGRNAKAQPSMGVRQRPPDIYSRAELLEGMDLAMEARMVRLLFQEMCGSGEQAISREL